MTMVDILSGLDGQQFRLVFQPTIDCKTKAVTGFETLARWDHPKLGLVMPDRFIPIAESCGLLGRLTEQIVTKGLTWYAGTPEVQGMSISINIPLEAAGEVGFAEWLSNECHLFGIATGCVLLEISAMAVVEDTPNAIEMFHRLQQQGFRVAIDHFGLCEISPSMLASLSVNEIKVDKSIAMADSDSGASRSIIQSAVDHGHQNGVVVVTEGVEERDILEYLDEVGCDLAQGYYISCPIAGDLVVDWMLGHDESLRQNLL